MLSLAALFALTALLYASVGFGGGSTYNALLALSGVDYRILPVIALSCNIVVVTGGTVRHALGGVLPWRRAVPLALVSAPFAWAGGLTPIPRTLFLGLLGASLAVAGLLLLIQRERVHDPARAASGWQEPAIGAAIGYLSGLVGIGGGIFLSPFLFLQRWGAAREIAATASFFILVNSLAGLAGQLMKLGGSGQVIEAFAYWPLALAVLVGGQIGAWAGMRLLPAHIVRRLTGVLVLYVAVRLLIQSFG